MGGKLSLYDTCNEQIVSGYILFMICNQDSLDNLKLRLNLKQNVSFYCTISTHLRFLIDILNTGWTIPDGIG